jgi:hypothetical protein
LAWYMLHVDFEEYESSNGEVKPWEYLHDFAT